MASPCILIDPASANRFNFDWKIYDGSSGDDKTAFQFVHLVLKIAENEIPERLRLSFEQSIGLLLADAKSGDFITVTPKDNGLLYGWLYQLLHTTRTPDSRLSVILVVPQQEGYVIRSDFLEERFRGSQEIRQAIGFVQPRQLVRPSTSNENSAVGQIVSFLASAVGGIVLEDQSKFPITRHTLHELQDRLAFPWLSTAPIIRRRIALIGEVRPYHLCARLFQAARALGIDLVVVDSAGHWLQDENSTYVNLREAFIEVNMEVDIDLPRRIAEVICSYPHTIDGVTTVTEFLLIPVARAAEILGLPTSPSAAFAKSVDKYETRQTQGSDACILLSGPEELDKFLSNAQQGFPPAPWIVKPCNGWHSLNVMKATTPESLRVAIEVVSRHTAYSRSSASHESKWQTNVLVEEYCDGPEMDANFVLWRGEILFFEVVDNFPCTADSGTGSVNADFKETQLVFPSALPEAETLQLRQSLYESIRRLGYESGIFHVEARMRNSTYEYRQDESSKLDLQPKLTAPSKDPGVFLVEVNARPPGYVDASASAFTNGVDMFALQLLLALQDEARIRALSLPFKSRPHVVISAIQADKSGTIVSQDPWRDFHQRKPELISRVFENPMNFKKGDWVADPKLNTTPWLSGFAVYSFDGRASALEAAGQVKEGFECLIE
ncbi:hypothetical protein P170DRAFT_453654 [Aspergillus steynii IBT 23096]|uniref:ATP-grasp domain-containing protein n=1 Tax=Aspergillus steynii IBT 23096 TaxID=1392250 RepID=A0A2I2GH21_9EURO|nr:uncharacterized protein P170DRAFT_453654 [Aspergillus steynii IBT 23096]PLB52176.1 hypothetical protein P170DRAFT_453654 [Aspergillus steynii IBT 23096]